MTRFNINLGILLSASLSCLTAATTVSILELGSSGTLHSTDSTSSLTSTQGVLSFWKSIHSADSNGTPRKHSTTQYPGMSVVPDLFAKPTGGLVLGIFGEVPPLEEMPTLAKLMDAQVSVGQFTVPGQRGRDLMRLGNAQPVHMEEFPSVLKGKAALAAKTEVGNRLDAISLRMEQDDSGNVNAKQVDEALAEMLEYLTAQDSSIILHVVMDDEASSNPRRRLEDKNNGDNAAAYEIPGYYDGNGVFHTRFRTIFEIQYFNIVLWTAVGLLTIIASANYMTMYMPLMPDTLLFGESAKMVAE